MGTSIPGGFAPQLGHPELDGIPSWFGGQIGAANVRAEIK
jgi:hypothetical protein